MNINEHMVSRNLKVYAGKPEILIFLKDEQQTAIEHVQNGVGVRLHTAKSNTYEVLPSVWCHASTLGIKAEAAIHINRLGNHGSACMM